MLVINKRILQPEAIMLEIKAHRYYLEQTARMMTKATAYQEVTPRMMEKLQHYPAQIRLLTNKLILYLVTLQVSTPNRIL